MKNVLGLDIGISSVGWGIIDQDIVQPLSSLWCTQKPN